MIFLFHAFVDHLLRELYQPESEPVLALEEPETHLHPQAVRTLWHHIDGLPGQKIVTTHSPYFVQNVPFRDLRLVRLTSKGTEVRSLPEEFSVSISPFDGLDEVVSTSNDLLTYNKTSQTLTVRGSLDEGTYSKLIRHCGENKRRDELSSKLRSLRDRSMLYIEESELQSLETFARRMRGEIFFAERWLIVEGQADYLIVHAMACALGYDLDRHGVAVIDAQNNGSPAIFAALARAISIPWLAVFDGDQAGVGFKQAIANRGFSDEELSKRVRTHSAGNLEAQLIAEGLGPELKAALVTLEVHEDNDLSDDNLKELLRENKIGYAALLASSLRFSTELAQRAPKAFRDAIEQMRGLT